MQSYLEEHSSNNNEQKQRKLEESFFEVEDKNWLGKIGIPLPYMYKLNRF